MEQSDSLKRALPIRGLPRRSWSGVQPGRRATVYMNETTPGRYDFIVEGDNGVATAHTNRPLKAVVRIASNCGWD